MRIQTAFTALFLVYAHDVIGQLTNFTDIEGQEGLLGTTLTENAFNDTNGTDIENRAIDNLTDNENFTSTPPTHIITDTTTFVTNSKVNKTTVALTTTTPTIFWENDNPPMHKEMHDFITPESSTTSPNGGSSLLIIVLCVAGAGFVLIVVIMVIVLICIMRAKDSDYRATHSGSSTHRPYPIVPRRENGNRQKLKQTMNMTRHHDTLAIIPTGNSGTAFSSENDRLRVTNVNNPGLEPDHIGAEHFRHHGVLQIPDPKSISLRHDLENDKSRSVHASDHVSFDSKQFVVRDIGPGVEIVPSSDDNSKPLDLGITLPVQDDSQPRPPQPKTTLQAMMGSSGS